MIGKYFASLREKSGFDKLNQREKLTVAIGISFLICFIVIQFGISPYISASNKLDSSIVKKREELVKLQLMQQEYRELRKEAGGIKERLQKRPASFSLFSFLDKQATDADIKDLIAYMKPSVTESEGEVQESVVEMKLQKINLKQLVDFLKLVESPENVVSIKRISIQESVSEKGLLEIIMQIVTFVNNG